MWKTNFLRWEKRMSTDFVDLTNQNFTFPQAESLWKMIIRKNFKGKTAPLSTSVAHLVFTMHLSYVTMTF